MGPTTNCVKKQDHFGLPAIDDGNRANKKGKKGKGMISTNMLEEDASMDGTMKMKGSDDEDDFVDIGDYDLWTG